VGEATLMSYGVACEECSHFEEAHDKETGACLATWGSPSRIEACWCKKLVLPPDADEQREFARRMRKWEQ